MRSLRVRIALSAALLCALVVFVFAGFSAYWFHHEQIDLLSEDGEHSATPEQLADAADETGELIATYLFALPLAALLAGAGAWWLAARLARPLHDLTSAAKGIDAQSLDRRLPEPAGRDEIFTLAQALNHLLDRLERSFRQSARFSADASHELRTPLAIMRSQLEHAIKDHPQGEQTKVLVELLEQNQRLASISEKLLLLARADAGRLLPGLARLELSTLVAEVAEDYGIIAVEQGLAISGEVEPGVLAEGDEGLLRQLVLNLFDNALRHNIVGGWVRYRLSRIPEGAALSVSNSGAPIPERSRSLLFDRFYRLDESRDSAAGGAGLGLSLCREIANAHGGSIRLASSGEAGNEFRLELPALPG